MLFHATAAASAADAAENQAQGADELEVGEDEDGQQELCLLGHAAMEAAGAQSLGQANRPSQQGLARTPLPSAFRGPTPTARARSAADGRRQ